MSVAGVPDDRAIRVLRELGWNVELKGNLFTPCDACLPYYLVTEPSGFGWSFHLSDPEAPRYLEWLARGAMAQDKAPFQLAPPKPTRPTPPRVVPSGRLHRDIARLQRLRSWVTPRRRPQRVDLP